MTNQLSLSFACRHIHQRRRFRYPESPHDENEIVWCEDCDRHICNECEATIPPGGEMYLCCKECNDSTYATTYTGVPMCEHGLLLGGGAECHKCNVLARRLT